MCYGDVKMSKTSIACLAFNEGKVLIAHRLEIGDMGGRWEFPGGKVEAGESDEAAIVREFQEEFGVTVQVHEKITEAEFEHRGHKIALHAWRITVPHDGISKPYVLTEHSGYKWVFPDEIKNLNFVDSDLLIYPSVVDFAKKAGLVK